MLFIFIFKILVSNYLFFNLKKNEEFYYIFITFIIIKYIYTNILIKFK